MALLPHYTDILQSLLRHITGYFCLPLNYGNGVVRLCTHSTWQGVRLFIKQMNVRSGGRRRGGVQRAPGAGALDPAVVQELGGPGSGAATRVLTFPFATALHLNLRLASARNRASCSSLAKVQCRFWLLLWYILKSETRPRKSGGKDPKRHHTVV